jgi:hypothetical protein
MTRHFLLAGLVPLLLVAAGRADDIESRLLQKFNQNAKAGVDKLRQFVDASVTQAKAIKETDPEGALELLRKANVRIDQQTLVSYADRKALLEGIRPFLQEVNDQVVLRKRLQAVQKVGNFRDFLENVAPDLKYPGRSGPDHWEPAFGVDPAGRPQLVALQNITGVNFKSGSEERKMPPSYFPWLQVAGGVYVFDLSVGHHIWMTNRQFFEQIFMPTVDAYLAEDMRNRGLVGATSRSTLSPVLQAEVDSGVFFVRSTPNISPIPGIIPRQETEFLEFAAQRLIKKSLPTPMNRIYDREMLDRVAGLSSQQVSTVYRCLQQLRQKGVATSKLYAEILREETASVLRSEFNSWDDASMNKALLYLFGKLKE